MISGPHALSFRLGETTCLPRAFSVAVLWQLTQISVLLGGILKLRWCFDYNQHIEFPCGIDCLCCLSLLLFLMSVVHSIWNMNGAKSETDLNKSMEFYTLVTYVLLNNEVLPFATFILNLCLYQDSEDS